MLAVIEGLRTRLHRVTLKYSSLILRPHPAMQVHVGRAGNETRSASYLKKTKIEIQPEVEPKYCSHTDSTKAHVIRAATIYRMSLCHDIK